MIDLSHPETWTVAAMLIAAIIALVRGDVIPGRTHDKIVAELKDQTARLRDECDTYRQMAFRGVQLSETSLEVIKKVKE